MELDLEKLDSFLRANCNDVSVVKAHGFFTAVASFPKLIMPSEWIYVLIPEFNSIRNHPDSAKTLTSLIGLFLRTAKDILRSDEIRIILSAQDPYLTLSDAPVSLIQEWCNGYCTALMWNDGIWLNTDHKYISQACSSFFLLTQTIKDNDKVNINKQTIVNEIPILVKALFLFWLSDNEHLKISDDVMHNSIDTILH